VKAVTLGATVLRVNAFNDDPARAGDSAIQVAPLRYDEAGLQGLDWVLATAARHGLRLILPLGNAWDAYGGARQYVAWAGLRSPREADARFFTEPRVVAHYLAHLRNLLARVSAVDGLPYRRHPAVLGWELLNEPRGRSLDRGGQALRRWIDEVGRVVKEAAPGQLLGTGEEGHGLVGPEHDRAFWRRTRLSRASGSGARFDLDTASPFVDFASVHCYPESWGVLPALLAEAGERWIREHAEVAHRLGKPLLVGELGLRRDGPLPPPARREALRRWLASALEAGAGAVPWLFAPDGRPADWDPHTFHLRDGASPDDPVNAVAGVVLEASRAAARLA
jgi:mannan endo-1,4-beta-mannosidase